MSLRAIFFRASIANKKCLSDSQRLWKDLYMHFDFVDRRRFQKEVLEATNSYRSQRFRRPLKLSTKVNFTFFPQNPSPYLTFSWVKVPKSGLISWTVSVSLSTVHSPGFQEQERRILLGCVSPTLLVQALFQPGQSLLGTRKMLVQWLYL